jgi:hypothetical protein
MQEFLFHEGLVDEVELPVPPLAPSAIPLWAQTWPFVAGAGFRLAKALTVGTFTCHLEEFQHPSIPNADGCNYAQDREW